MTQQGIGKRAFIQAFILLFLFMIGAGILTQIIPAGQFNFTVNSEGKEVLVPGSYQETGDTDFPIWRWFTAPVEVLWSEDSLIIISIIIVILFIEGSFSILASAGIIRAVLFEITDRFSEKRYLLLALNTLVFMSFGAFFGIFEEVIPIVSIMVPLAYALGWDSLTGLGMSILATGFGFSAAIFNPFSIGIAQQIAGVPIFSGTPYRLLIFSVTYILLTGFLILYAKRIEKTPSKSLVFEEDIPHKEHYHNHITVAEIAHEDRPGLKRGMIAFAISMGLILIAMVVISVSRVNIPLLPVIGLLFLIGGFAAGLASDLSNKQCFIDFGKGMLNVLPGAVLILMAMSVKFIISEAGTMATILHLLASKISGSIPITAVLIIFALTLVLNFFIGSASAKAFLIMPLIVPLAELIGVTPQTSVLAFAFGDGFSNMLYPTNPVLLIALSMTVVSFPKWLRFVFPIQFLMILFNIGFLILAVVFGYA